VGIIHRLILLRNPHAVALVVPEGLTIEEIEAQERRQSKDENKPDFGF